MICAAIASKAFIFYQHKKKRSTYTEVKLIIPGKYHKRETNT